MKFFDTFLLRPFEVVEAWLSLKYLYDQLNKLSSDS